MHIVIKRHAGETNAKEQIVLVLPLCTTKYPK